jgi:PAS domain S-box-containing protein
MAEKGDTPVNILVVDDRPENHVALRAILSMPGYRIVGATSGPEALRQLLDEDFAVLLIDVVMPGMSGLELASIIRQRERTATVPIVFLTAQSTDAGLAYEGYQAGGVDYLVRPLAPETVRAKVAVFADLYRKSRRIEEQARLLVSAERDANELRLLELRIANDRHYRYLAEAIPQIVWTARPDGVVDYFNQRWFEYTGLSAQETGGSWERALCQDDVPRCREQWHDRLRQARMFQVECRLRRGSDGTFRWHLCRAAPERSTTGAVISWLGTFTDIEDQKRAHAALTEFKGTLDAVLDTVLIFDPNDGRVLYANEGASALVRYSEEELRHMKLIDLLSEHDSDGLRELLAPVRDASSAVVTIETKVRRKDGLTVPVEMSLQLIRVDGGRIVAIARDITDRKRAQLERELLYREAVDAIRTRDEFLSIASHELRTPLASLQLQLQMLLRPSAKDPPAAGLSDQIKARLGAATKQAERLNQLIGELMDVSKIAAGRLSLHLEETDLWALVREVLLRLGDEAAKARCPISLVEPVAVVGRWDRVRIEQVVTNLLTNALKFGAGSPIDVVVESTGHRGRVSVRDRGIGVAPEDTERIFHRYEQAVSARDYGGMGLGLYIVRQIVEAHGGTIRVESEPGSGSTFIVDLPFEPVVPRGEEDRALSDVEIERDDDEKPGAPPHADR